MPELLQSQGQKYNLNVTTQIYLRMCEFHTLSLQSHLPEKTGPQETFDLKGSIRINLSTHATTAQKKEEKDQRLL